MDVPAALPATADACHVVKHAIVVMLDFPCIQAKDLPSIERLTTGLVDMDGTLGLLHPAQRSAGSADRPIFAKGTLPLAPDLHPATRSALVDGAADTTPDSLPCLSLTAHGVRLLNGDLARPPGDPRNLPGFVSGRGLAILLGQQSKARIVAAGGEDEPFLRVHVDGLDVVTFGSEIGMALVRLSIERKGPINLAHVQESLHVLSNAARGRSIGWACEANPERRFTLRHLVEAVLTPAGCAGTEWNRLFTYTYAQLAQRPASGGLLDTAAWRLSRHYTSGYGFGPDSLVGTVLSRPFDDIVHAASMEGVASLTVPLASFLQDSFASRVENCYLPLALLALHEHVQLLDMAQRASGALARAAPDAAGEGSRTEALRRLIDAFLSFRLRYRLAIVSEVTMHNAFYAAVRGGLEVETLTRKLAGDTADAARALQDGSVRTEAKRSRRLHAEHLRRERGRAWVIGMFTGLLTFLTAVTALKEAIHLVGEWPHAPDWKHLPELVVALVAAGLAIWSGWVTARRHRDAHHGAEPEDETGEDWQTELRTEGVNVAAHHTTLPPAASVTGAVAAVQEGSR